MTHNNFTVWDEVIEDAILSAELLRADPRVSKVFVLGHSLGGVLAPRIHASGGNFDGLILIAATPRHLLEVAIEQITADIMEQYDLLEDGLREQFTGYIEELTEFYNNLPNISEEDALTIQVPFMGGYAYYMRDLALHPFEDYVQYINVPVLAIQGRNDFQVLAGVDFVMLQELFKNHSNITFKLYDVDHMLSPSTATSFAEHRDQILARTGARVYEPLMRDIVDWVKGMAQ